MEWLNTNLLPVIWFLSCVIFTAFLVILRLVQTQTRRKIILVLSFAAAAILLSRIIYFPVRGYYEGGASLAWRQFVFALPGHLCGISSIVIPMAVLSRKKILLDYTYFVALPAALFAIVLNSSVGVTSFIGDFDTYVFWFPHLLYVMIPIYLIIFEGLRPDIKSIPKVMLTLVVILTIGHIVNKTVSYAFNDYVVNYMYTMGPGDFVVEIGRGLSEKKFYTIGFLRMVWDFMPVEYLYMYLLMPLACAVFLLLGLPFAVLRRRSVKSNC